MVFERQIKNSNHNVLYQLVEMCCVGMIGQTTDHINKDLYYNNVGLSHKCSSCGQLHVCVLCLLVSIYCFGFFSPSL